MNTIWDKSLKELRDSTATDKPIATAGAVSTLGSVFGCSLLIMVLEILSAKTNDQRKKRKAGILITEFRKRMDELSAYPDQDIYVFKRFMDSFSLPDTSRHEKDLRINSIRKHRMEVIGIPMRAALSILDCYPYIEKMIELTNGSLLADIATGTQLLDASLQSLLWTVQVNTRDLDQKELKHIQRERKKIARAAREHSAKILDRIRAMT
jgi:formiminotetrahydrofolate cyclodeaminase